jgi:hypothetical protein
MPCVNHPDKETQSYCQNCGKALCSACVRNTPSGQVLCDPCLAATTNQAAGPIPPFFIPAGGPNPSAAAVLGLIPGVGAMYNGQLFKGLIHVVIFAILVSITEHYPVFGIFIGAWVLYQSFEAYHTAKARRDGQPLPDPFGLNELGSWLNLGMSGRTPTAPPPGASAPPGTSANAGPTPPNPGYANAPYPNAPYENNPYPNAPYTNSWTGSAGPGAIPEQPPYNEPYTGGAANPYGDPYGAGPIPPIPPHGWRRREPVFAIVLIGLGLIFLLQSFGFVSHILHYLWPLMLIGLGVWLIMRQTGFPHGGRK